MKVKNLFVLFAVAVSLISCKEEELTIQGQVKVYNAFIPEDMQAPIVGLPVSILLSPQAIENIPIAQQKLIYNCRTDKNGYYRFTIKESDQHTLDRYNAYLIKTTAFDSTRVEWQFISDSTAYKIFKPTVTSYFSQAIGHSLNPSHGFKLMPAGWVYFKFENLNHNSVRVSNGYNFSIYYKANSSANNTCLFLHPSKVHEIQIQDYQNLGNGYLGVINLFVRNSFMRSSRPWHEDLKPDTVIVDMSTMTVRMIKANLDM